MNFVDLCLRVVMNHYNYVMYVFWMHCMRDWLKNGVFGLKIRILQVWYWWTLLKRSSVRLSEHHYRMEILFVPGSLKRTPQRTTRLELRLSELHLYSMPENPFLTHQYRP